MRRAALHRCPIEAHLAREDDPITVREFGALARDDIAPERMLVDLGSSTKLVTALMTAQRVERGELRFDESLREIFGSDMPDDKADIRVHQLLTHSAGFNEVSGDDDEPLERDAFLERAFASDLIDPPGERYAYSNIGYGVIARCVHAEAARPSWAGRLVHFCITSDILRSCV